MTVKEYLSCVKLRQEEITETEEYIERLRTTLGIAGIDYERDKIQTSVNGDKLSDTFVKIFEAEEKLKRMKENFVVFRIDVMSMIQQIPERKHREILNHVYLDYMKLKQVADLMGYSYDYIRELHLEALNSVSEIFPHKFD